MRILFLLVLFFFLSGDSILFGQTDTIIQFRIRPIKTLLDANPPVVEKVVKKLDGIKSYTIFDDRVSDAMFITLEIELGVLNEKTFDDIKNALRKLPRVEVYLVDHLGNETQLGKVSYEDFLKHLGDKKNN